MITISDTLIKDLTTNPMFKTDTRVLFFLLSHPEAVSTGDIAEGCGVSRKCLNKSLKRLTGAGIILPGEPEPKVRRFTVPSCPVKETVCSPEPEPSDTLLERIGRIEAAIERLVSPPGSIQAPAVTVSDIQAATSEPVKTRASNIASSLAFLSLEKAASMPASMEFMALFGVPVPEGFSDLAAVSEMNRRKKAGKLDNLKSPIGYLNSLAGKVIPVGSNQPPAVDMQEAAMKLKIQAMWEAMSDDQKQPYRKPFTGKASTFRVPVELLARQRFYQEQVLGGAG